MSRNHTFLTRGLAMVLALVMIVSCANLGLVLPALAADNGESLYALIEKSDVGTPALRAVLAAGGLPGDQTINYSEPSEDDAEDLLVLKNGVLTAAEYADAEGNTWVPYSYGTVGNENLFSGNSAEWTEENVNVIYALNLGSEIVAEPLAMAAELADEAGVQNAILRNFYDTYQDNLKAMRKGVLNGLKDEVEYTPATAEVKADFVGVIDSLKGLINNDTGYLNFYHTLESYQTEGLAYYYANWQTVVAQMTELSKYMNSLVETEEKLEVLNILCDNIGYAGYGDKFIVLADALVEATNTLTAPSSKIDLSNEALVSALDLAMGVQEYEEKDLVLYSTNLYVLDSTYAYVIVTVNGPNGDMKIPVKFENGGIISVEEIYAQLEATAAAMLGDKAPYYTLDASAADALAGATITENIELTCAWEAVEYTVKIGDADQIVTINDLTITLPGHPEDGHEYHYTIGEKVIEADEDVEHKFAVADLDTLFVDGVLTIDRVDYNRYSGDLEGLIAFVNEKIGKENAFELVKGEEGDYTGLYAKIEMGDLAAFGEALITNDYYNEIKLNNQVFYDGEYVSVQALIDALLNDGDFKSENLIALGQNGEGEFLHTTMQLKGYEENNSLDFVLYLTSVPAEMTKVSKALNAVKDYMSFKGGEGYLDVTMTLPEKVYEGYLTAAIGAGYAEGSDLDSFKNTATVQFVKDYFDLLMNSDVTTTTFENTLATVGIERDLSDYEGYWQTVKAVATGDDFECTINDSMIDVTVPAGSDNIEKVLNLLGLNSATIRFGTSAIKDETLKVRSTVTLTNNAGDFEALVINPAKVTETGAKNKINAVDYTSNLVETVNNMNGKSMVILLDDIYGDLNFPGAAVIDLNGKTIHGNINVNGSVVIVDSALVTYNGGAVTGSVSAVRGAITGGTYGGDVSKFLRDGYTQDNGAVKNGMFYVVLEDGAFNFVLNADFYNTYNGYLPSVAALATEITADLAMNSYPDAALSYGSDNIYAAEIDNILGSYIDGNPIDSAITDMCNYLDVKGINALANDIIDDMTDLKAVSAALENGGVIGSYKFTVNPYAIDLNYVEGEDYLDFGLGYSKNVSKSFGIALSFEGENKYYEYTKDLIAAMSEILTIDAQVELYQPTYAENTNTLSVGGNAYADFVLDLSANSDYNKGLAIILAYGNPEWTEEIANAKNCVLVLNKIIEQMTVEDVFTALKVMDRNTSMTEMADAIGYKYSAEEIEELEEIYHVLLCGIGKVYEILEDNADSEPVTSYVKNFSAYKEALAILLAYGKEEWSDDLANGKDAAVVVKNIIAQMDVQDFFDALKVIDSNVTIAKMADAIGLEISSEDKNVLEGVLNSLKTIVSRVTVKEMADAIGYEFGVTEHSTLADVRNILEYALGKIGDKLNITNNENVLSCYQTNSHTYTYSADVSAYGDATVKGYTGVFDVDYIKGSMTIKLAPKCTRLIGDVNWDGVIDTDDAALICKYDTGRIDETGLHMCVADVNADGAIDTDDAALICKYDTGRIVYEDFPAVNP